jgi:hypothetical protein
MRSAIARWRAGTRTTLRIGPVLAVAAVAGYLLGGCSGDGSTGLPGLSGVTELPTGSVPSLTLPTRTEASPTTTAEAPTTTLEPETVTQPATTVIPTETAAPTPTPTAPATTSTGATDTGEGEPPTDGFWGWIALVLAAARGETTTPETPTTTSADTSPMETVAAEPASSETSTPWGWIALALGLALAGVVGGVVIWRRGRASAGS